MSAREVAVPHAAIVDKLKKRIGEMAVEIAMLQSYIEELQSPSPDPGSAATPGGPLAFRTPGE